MRLLCRITSFSALLHTKRVFYLFSFLYSNCYIKMRRESRPNPPPTLCAEKSCCCCSEFFLLFHQFQFVHLKNKTSSRVLIFPLHHHRRRRKKLFLVCMFDKKTDHHRLQTNRFSNKRGAP